MYYIYTHTHTLVLFVLAFEYTEWQQNILFFFLAWSLAGIMDHEGDWINNEPTQFVV